MSVFALVPARGGSRRLPRKALARLGDMPLLAWTIRPALACGLFDHVILSTDDADYAHVGETLGAEVALRPAALATDTASSRDVLNWHLGEWSQGGSPDLVMLLQPTSPFRSIEDISLALDLMMRQPQLDALTSVVRLDRLESHAGDPSDWPHRLDAAGFEPELTGPLRADPPALSQLAFNGAIYLVRPERFATQIGDAFLQGRVGLFEMPPERSVDIDTATDLERARSLLVRKGWTV